MNDNHIQKGKIFIASMDLCTVQLDKFLFNGIVYMT